MNNYTSVRESYAAAFAKQAELRRKPDPAEGMSKKEMDKVISDIIKPTPSVKGN
jgi:hypothetical protein